MLLRKQQPFQKWPFAAEGAIGIAWQTSAQPLRVILARQRRRLSLHQPPPS
ncbi:MAG: hypothetical protein ACLUEQ_04000 [Cloacibacillus evryensis]